MSGNVAIDGVRFERGLTTKSRCLLVSDSRPLRTPVKMYHRSTLGFTTLIFKSQEHYEKCKEYYD